MPLEVLHFPLVLFGCRTRLERAQVAASTGAGILLSRIKPVLAGCKFTDHRGAPFWIDIRAISAPN